MRSKRRLKLVKMSPLTRNARFFVFCIKPSKIRSRAGSNVIEVIAEMRILCELCIPFVKVGGSMLAMKGKNAEFELSGAKRAIATLGGASPEIESVTLLGGAEEFTHPIITVKKKTKTPAAYPRAYAQISKKPL